MTSRAAVHQFLPPVLANRYEVMGELARGGCGFVVEARDRRLDRLVAIKCLKPGGYDEASAARLSREARVAAAVHHPNVCAVTDVGMLGDGTPFLVMERLYGESLRSYLGRARRLEAEDAVEVGLQLLSGLEAAHSLGIVHRDVKPENVFLVPRHGCAPLVKLLDFGMCRRVVAEVSLRDDATLTRAGTVVGTPEYMSPEQASGQREFDARIDLYAVGVVLYEALTGTRAFFGENARAVLVSVLSKQLPPLRVVRPDLPAAVDRAVSCAMDKDSRRRYRRATDFQADLLEARAALAAQRAAAAAAAPVDDDTYNETSGDVAISEWDMPTRRFSRPLRRPAQAS